MSFFSSIRSKYGVDLVATIHVTLAESFAVTKPENHASTGSPVLDSFALVQYSDGDLSRPVLPLFVWCGVSFGYAAFLTELA